MSRQSFQPKTRQFNEREIVRFQQDFSGGLWEDIDPPDNGVSVLENFINFGSRLEGRGGSKQWSEGTLPTLPNRGPYTASKLGNTITVSGGDFTEADVGNWFYWPDSATYEYISAYTDAENVTTTDSTTHSGPIANCYMRGPLNGQFYHKTEHRVLLQLGTKVYYSSVDLATWTEIYCISSTVPNNSHSTFDELNQWAIMFNSNGIFKIDMSASIPIMYRVNENGPSAPLTSAGSGNYKRRYLYSFLRLSGSGLRDRTTSGVVIEQESSCNQPNDYLVDYAEILNSSSIASGNGNTVGSLSAGSSLRQWTHYAIYATTDTGVNGIDPLTEEENNPEKYIWLMDIPIVKTFTMSGDATSNTLTATTNVFSQSDVGSTVYFYAGGSATITAYNSPNQVTISVSSVATTIGAIGSEAPTYARQSGQTVTASTADTFSESDVGKTIMWEDGSTSYIIGYTSGTVVTVHNSRTYPSSNVNEVAAIAFDITTRKFFDNVPDDDDNPENTQLRARQNAFIVYQRFFTPLPSGNVGAVTPLFMFVASESDEFLYYCQIPAGYEYLIGSHFVGFQYHRFKDSLEAVHEMTDKLAVFCHNSTHTIPLNTYNEIQAKLVGESIAVTTGQTVADSRIGVIDRGGIQATEIGALSVITSEPAHRLFDGERYGPNLSENRIQKELQSWQYSYASAYDPFIGYVVWGLK